MPAEPNSTDDVRFCEPDHMGNAGSMSSFVRLDPPKEPKKNFNTLGIMLTAGSRGCQATSRGRDELAARSQERLHCAARSRARRSTFEPYPEAPGFILRGNQCFSKNRLDCWRFHWGSSARFP